MLTAAAGILAVVLLLPAPERKNQMSSSDDPTQALELDQSIPVDYADLLQEYKTWAKYPPRSRPLREENADVIEPAMIHMPARRIPFHAEGKAVLTDHHCQLQAQRHTIAEGEKGIITLFCATKEIGGVRSPLKIEKILLKGSDPSGEWNIGSQQIIAGDDGQNGDQTAGDLIYTIQFTPSRSDWGDIAVETEFLILNEKKPALVSMLTSFFSSPVAPAHFTGRVYEELKEGSLILSVELEVRIAGRYRVLGNLKGPEGAIAYSKEEIRLEPGTRLVPLQFYGKILRDNALDGPYTLVDVRGHRMNLFLDPEEVAHGGPELDRKLQNWKVTEPEVQAIPHNDFVFKTDSYRFTDFTEEEYQSDEKAQRIRYLEQKALEES